MGVAQKDILNGWKEIAGYVARDIRTVERWEKQRGLPVRRVPGAGRATVYARISELEQWLASKPLEGENAGSEDPDTSSRDALGRDVPMLAGHVVEEPFAHPAVATSATEAVPSRRTLTYSAIAAALILVTVGTFYLHARATTAPTRPAEVANRPITVPHSMVPGVEESYLRGSYLYEQRTPESLAQALDSFKTAIQRDPNYAPAYAGLANTYNLLREYSVMPDETAYPLAREAAQRAIALDPGLAEAYVSLGFVSYYWDLNPAAADHEFQEAISLDPTLAQAHHWYGSVLTHEGRFPEALHELEIAQHLQPSSSAILTSRAYALGMSGHVEQGRAMLRDLLSHNGFGDDPNSTTAHLVLGILSLAQPRDWPTQFAQWRQIAALKKNDADLLNFVNVVEPAYKRGGEPELMRAMFAFERKTHPAPTYVSFRMIEAEASLGHLDQAFGDLNLLVDRHDEALCALSMDPLLMPLHADPRFAQLRARIGLPKLTS